MWNNRVHTPEEREKIREARAKERMVNRYVSDAKCRMKPDRITKTMKGGEQ